MGWRSKVYFHEPEPEGEVICMGCNDAEDLLCSEVVFREFYVHHFESQRDHRRI